MLDQAIVGFFDERKEAWLKKKIKGSMQDFEVKELELECKEIFSLTQWLPNAARRAGQISMATHPCTFSHPSARKNKNGYVSSVIAKAERLADGFLRTGNVVVETDALGNAAALDVYKFLTLKMSDGQQLLAHIQQETALAENLLNIETSSYQVLKQGFLAMADGAKENITSSKIKQVYSPVNDDYHQLSVLSNSGMIYQLKKRIDRMRFSEEAKEMRELKRKNEYAKNGFAELYGLTTIGYGGTKPQNISVLNNQNGGKAHLLLSLPPSLSKRDVCFPKNNFFTESLRYYECREQFHALYEILKTDYNNIKIREGRDYRLQEIIDKIIDRMWAVRSVASEQYLDPSSQLKAHQKIWLSANTEQEREETDQWLDKLCKETSQWISQSYSKVMGKQAIKVGDNLRIKINEMVEQNKEALR